MRASISVRRGSRSGAGALTYSSRGHLPRQLELVLQPRDVHARPDQTVPLPVQPGEHIAFAPGKHGTAPAAGAAPPLPRTSPGGAATPRWRARAPAAPPPASPASEIT